MTDDSDESDGGATVEDADWPDWLPGPAVSAVGQMRDGVVGAVNSAGETSARFARWLPVLNAGRELAAELLRIGRYLASRELDEDRLPEDLFGQLTDRIRQLFDAFPNIADLYGDIDALDAKIRGLDTKGADSALSRYLTLLRSVVDQLMRRAVDRVFDAKEKKLSPERVEAFLERLDAVLAEVLERWILPATIDAGTSGGPADEPPRSSTSDTPVDESTSSE